MKRLLLLLKRPLKVALPALLEVRDSMDSRLFVTAEITEVERNYIFYDPANTLDLKKIGVL
jgi:hypothetical protein